MQMRITPIHAFGKTGVGYGSFDVRGIDLLRLDYIVWVTGSGLSGCRAYSKRKDKCDQDCFHFYLGRKALIMKG